MRLQSIYHLPLILASSAVWRSQALTQLGIPHQPQTPAYEEPSYLGGPLEDHVKTLALGKAKSLLRPGIAVIGMDQMIEVDGEVLGKPGGFDAALLQLKKLNGKRHRLVNGLAVVFQGETISLWDQCFLVMRDLSHVELQAYLHLDQPFDCAGSYKIESVGASLFESVEVRDVQSIMGVPGNLLINALRELGFSNLLPP